MAAISNDVATGRRMKGREGLMCRSRCRHYRRRPGDGRRDHPDGCLDDRPGTASRGVTFAVAGAALTGHVDLVSVFQLVEGAVGDLVAGIDAVHLRLAVIGDAGLDRALVDHAVLEDVDEEALAVLLDGGGRDQRRALEGLDQQTGVDKLVGEEAQVVVGEAGAHLDGAGGGVDLVVQREDFAAGKFRLRGTVEGFHAELGLSWASCSWTPPRLSSEMVKMTVIGCNCATTTSGVALLPAVTRLPGSTSRKPDAAR